MPSLNCLRTSLDFLVFPLPHLQDLLSLCTRVVRGLLSKLCPPLPKVEDPPAQDKQQQKQKGDKQGEFMP
jgi:hypothetical protein